ncbi:hypothetical protein Tco_1052042 [Tanacetum coccineum]
METMGVGEVEYGRWSSMRYVRWVERWRKDREKKKRCWLDNNDDNGAVMDCYDFDGMVLVALVVTVEQNKHEEDEMTKVSPETWYIRLSTMVVRHMNS